MKTRVQLALFATIVSIFALGTLTMHYYPLKFGFAASNSVCHINAKFDCDAVSASNFSSVFGIPLAAWGVVTNVVLFVMIFISFFEWSDNPERFKRWTLVLAGLGLGATVVMAAISLTQMTTYCPFCIAVYITSIITFFAVKGMLREPFFQNIQHDIPTLFGESKGILTAFVAIPILAYLTHQGFMENFGASQIDQLVRESVADWEAQPLQNFVAKPSLVMGPAPEAARMTLVEFADFRCGHCKRASYSLHAFVQSHPDVRFEFYSFPLDGACNDKIEGANGISCRLAAAVYCAEKDGKGWALHENLYDNQEEVNSHATVAEVDQILSPTVTQLGLNWERLQTCMTDPMTTDAIRAQAKQGALVNVQGTPTIFANGRQLNRGNVVPVLQAVHSKIVAGK